MSTLCHNEEPTDYSKSVGMTTRVGTTRTTNDCIEQVLDLSAGSQQGDSTVTTATSNRQKWNCEQDSALDLSRSCENKVRDILFASFT